MGLIDDIRAGTYMPDDDGPSVPRLRPGEGTTLAETASRIASTGDAMPTVRDFLDQLRRADDAVLAALVAEAPRPTSHPEADALLAGIAEHVCAVRGIERPAWTVEPSRFLDRFWFVSDVPGLRATALAQTPVALKRRGVFWPARSMERV